MKIISKIWSKFESNSFLINKIKKQVMKGEVPIGTPSLEKIHSYWQNPSDIENSPGKYTEPIDRSEMLLELINDLPGINNEDTILEIGCNVGRNLNHLYKNGFHSLSGIEINSNAIIEMNKHYPEMAKNSNILNGSVEEKIKEVQDNGMSICFTMAVLEHIHPKSNFIFNEMARISAKFLITIESENSYFSRMYPRDYGKIFTEIGLKEISSKVADKSDLAGSYMIRIFSKK